MYMENAQFNPAGPIEPDMIKCRLRVGIKNKGVSLDCEMLTPEESGISEYMTWWEYEDARLHPDISPDDPEIIIEELKGRHFINQDKLEKDMEKNTFIAHTFIPWDYSSFMEGYYPPGVLHPLSPDNKMPSNPFKYIAELLHISHLEYCDIMQFIANHIEKGFARFNDNYHIFDDSIDKDKYYKYYKSVNYPMCSVRVIYEDFHEYIPEISYSGMDDAINDEIDFFQNLTNLSGIDKYIPYFRDRGYSIYLSRGFTRERLIYSSIPGCNTDNVPKNIMANYGINRKKIYRRYNTCCYHYCKKCGTELAPEARFCYRCGSTVKNTCSKCGSEYRDGADICMYCGSPREIMWSVNESFIEIAERNEQINYLLNCQNSNKIVFFCGMEWYVIGVTRETCTLLCKDNVRYMELTGNGRTGWCSSNIRKWLNGSFYNMLENYKYSENIINTLSDTRLTDKVSILTSETVEHLDNLITSGKGYWWVLNSVNSSESIWKGCVIGPDGMPIDKISCQESDDLEVNQSVKSFGVRPVVTIRLSADWDPSFDEEEIRDMDYPLMSEEEWCKYDEDYHNKTYSKSNFTVGNYCNKEFMNSNDNFFLETPEVYKDMIDTFSSYDLDYDIPFAYKPSLEEMINEAGIPMDAETSEMLYASSGWTGDESGCVVF